MRITYINNDEKSMLIIKSCILCLISHARVANAALNEAPDAAVTTTGFFCLKTIISGEAKAILKASRAARSEELR